MTATRVSHLSDPRQTAEGINKALRRTDALSLSADQATLQVDRSVSVAGDLFVDPGSRAELPISTLLRPNTDDYTALAFVNFASSTVATIFGGTIGDRTLYIDCDHIVLEDLAEANVYLDATASQVDIKAGNVTKLSVVSTGVNLVGLVNAANDAAAATAGVPVNGLYRNGSVLMIRVA